MPCVNSFEQQTTQDWLLNIKQSYNRYHYEYLMMTRVDNQINIEYKYKIQNTKKMFAQFQNMIKKQANKISKSIPSDLLNLSHPQTHTDYSKTPQKYIINGRQIEQKKLLAQGAFGFIWLAQDASTKQQYALKRIICMTQDKIKSALTQKSLMQKLPQSPYIVKYHGGTVFRHEGNTVVVILMQLCPGGNLFDILQKRQGKGVPEQTVKTIAFSILTALSVLHKAGFIHRDIKIENVLIGKDKRMKICDFGSSTTEIVDFASVPKSQYEHIKQSIEAFTTPMYRPPQIVDPYLKYKVTGKTDLWMLGCTLYTMSYFLHPFVQANAVGIANAVYRFPNYPQQTKYMVSTKMQDFIRNLLTPNPEYRPSAEKMLEILTKWDDFTSIPLNQQAKKLKTQQQQKQQQNKKLNQKVSKYDGDIPMQQLIKLQQKLQNNNKQHYEKDKVSFITNQETAVLAKPQPQLQPHMYKNSNSNSNSRNNDDDFAVFTQQPKSSVVLKKQSATTNPNISSNIDVWGDAFAKPSSSSITKTISTTTSKPQNTSTNNDVNFDAFTNFMAPKVQPSPSTSTNNNKANSNVSGKDDLYQFFSNPTPTTTITTPNNTNNSNSNKNGNNINLLDL